MRYLELTRTRTYSLGFAVPLLVMYEAGAAFYARGAELPVRNGADVLLRALLYAGGVQGSLALMAGLLILTALLILLERRQRRIPLRAAPMVGMAAESVVYALALAVVLGTATQWILGALPVRLASETSSPLRALPLGEGIVLSLGAGFYEELVFRVLLVGAIFGIFRSSGLQRRPAAIYATLIGALAFSAFHYIGPFGDPLELPSFLFRFLAGLLFSAMFLIRGFGITAWSHALYDIFLLLGLHLAE